MPTMVSVPCVSASLNFISCNVFNFNKEFGSIFLTSTATATDITHSQTFEILHICLMFAVKSVKYLIVNGPGVKLKMLCTDIELTHNSIKSFESCNCAITADLSSIYRRLYGSVKICREWDLSPLLLPCQCLP